MYYNQQGYRNPVPAQAQSPNKMMVTGEGAVFAVPDRAMVTVGVITENQNLSAAQKENTDKTAAIINSLLALGIPHSDIQTAVYRIEPQYNYENGQQVFRGYKVEHQLQVTVKDLSKLGQVIEQAVASGANFVSSIQFTIANPDSFYNQALASAIQNAQQKAAAMARTLQVILNPVPLVVEELSQAQPPRPIPFQAMSLAQDSGVPIQPGENKITALVKIEFTYM
jgi:uncharacterized protein